MFNCLDIKYQTIVQLVQSPKSPTILVWPGMADTVPEAPVGQAIHVLLTQLRTPIKIFLYCQRNPTLALGKLHWVCQACRKSRRTGDTRTTNAAPYTHKDSFYIVWDIPSRPLANCIESDKHAESPRRTGSTRTNTAPYTHKDIFYIVRDIPPWPLANLYWVCLGISRSIVKQAVHCLTTSDCSCWHEDAKNRWALQNRPSGHQCPAVPQ